MRGGDSDLEILTQIVRLENAVGSLIPRVPFSRSVAVVNRRGGYDDNGLQKLARDMSHFIGLNDIIPLVHVRSQKEGVAGRVNVSPDGLRLLHLDVSPDVFKHGDSAIVKVIAHGLSHYFLSKHGLVLEDTARNERLTDITSIFLGFGSDVVGGSEHHSYEAGWHRTTKIGYLTFGECVFAYNVVRQAREKSYEIPFSDGLLGDYRYYFHRRWLEECAAWSESVGGTLKDVDLEFCNIEKVLAICPSAGVRMEKRIEAVRQKSVKLREDIENAGREVHSAQQSMRPLVAYVMHRKYGPKGEEDVVLRSRKLNQAAKGLNRIVSSRVRGGMSTWNADAPLVIRCPRCAGRLRLPKGLGHISVSCPKCRYAFDYSTKSPECGWRPWLAYWQTVTDWGRRVAGLAVGECLPLTFVVLFSLAIFGPSVYWHSDFHQERDAWSSIGDAKDELMGLRIYLSRWPNGRHAKDARRRVEECRQCEWKTLDKTSTTAVDKYLSRYPEVGVPMVRDEQYTALCRSPSYFALRDFRQVLSGSEPYYADVTNRIRRLVETEWANVVKADSDERYDKFARDYTAETGYAEKARERSDKLCSNYVYVCGKNKRHPYERYLELCPKGVRSGDVRRRLTKVRIAEVMQGEHARITAPSRADGMPKKMWLSVYAVTNKLPHDIEVLLGCGNFAKGITVRSKGAASVLIPTGVCERCVLVRRNDSLAPRPAYTKFEVLPGLYYEGFEMRRRSVPFGTGHRDGEWDESPFPSLDPQDLLLMDKSELNRTLELLRKKKEAKLPSNDGCKIGTDVRGR